MDKMEQILSMTVNSLPAKTWNWLHMNETSLAWKEVSVPCQMISADEQSPFPDTLFEETLKPLFEEKQTATCSFLSTENAKTVSVHISPAGSSSAGTVYLKAAKGSELTAFLLYEESEEKGALAVRTLVDIEEGAKVRLIQVPMLSEASPLVNDICARAAKDGTLELLQLFSGNGDVYAGCQTDLDGDGSSFAADIAYLEKGTQTLDMNYVSNHYGKKTICEIMADGTLKDSSRKLFRGTIDFKKGASGSVGQESESVLLLGNDAVNRTIPLILCAEEDVVGNHGAAIGEMDEETLFYYGSRGIDRKTAENMAARAKLDRVLGKVPDGREKEQIQKYLSEVVFHECTNE